jgi:hypothetical protein
VHRVHWLTSRLAVNPDSSDSLAPAGASWPPRSSLDRYFGGASWLEQLELHRAWSNSNSLLVSVSCICIWTLDYRTNNDFVLEPGTATRFQAAIYRTGSLGCTSSSLA